MRPAAMGSNADALAPGMMFDRYELLCPIARGGMASVWLGRLRGKHGFERLVAIKTILPEYALDSNFQKMFLEEARIVSGIDHPNVAKTLDLGEQHDVLYLVMEFVDGASISRMNKQLERAGSPMPIELSLRVLSDVCAGLHAAHELRGSDGEPLNVVHRDVSPQNILIGSNGTVKLIDFGVAMARDRLVEETGAGLTKGKTRYMSPEQAKGQPVDRRADIFAVGAMAYSIFEGVGPYEGPNDMARLHALLTQPEIASLPSKPAPAIEQVILRALRRDPAARFQTCAEMRNAIEDAMLKSKLRATTEDLAAFVLAKTAAHISERQKIVKLALDAAAGRAQFQNMLEDRAVQKRDRSSSDLLDPPSVPVIVTSPSHAIISQNITEAPVTQSAPAAMEVEPGFPLPEPPRRRLGVYAIAALMGVSALIGIAAFFTRHPAEVESSVASSAAPTTPPEVPTVTPSATALPVASSAAPVSTPAPVPSPVVTSRPPITKFGSAATPGTGTKRPPHKHDDDQIQ